MKLTFLGTAAAEGYPGIFCNCDNCNKARQLGGRNIRCRSSVLVNDDLIVDYGPDTTAQCLRYNVELHKVRDFLLTHSHVDHLMMIDMFFRSHGFRQKGTLAQSTIWGNEKSMDVFKDQIWKILAEQFGGGRPDLRPTRAEAIEELAGYLLLNLKEINPHDTANISERYTVHAIDAHHNEPEPTMNYIIEDGQKVVLYGTDTGPWTDGEWDHIESVAPKIDLVVLDCTVGTGMPGGHHSNTSFLETKEKFYTKGLISDTGRFFAHHFSHQWNFVHDDLVVFMKPHEVEVTYDGLVLDI